MENLKILVVDDEEDMQVIFADRLRMYGYDVLTASDGLEALDKVKEASPDLVLLDIQMPNMDGMEALKRIRSEYPEIPVIMITAYITSERLVEALLEQRAYDFIEKPFDPDLVRVKIQRALERRMLLRENEYLRSELTGKYRKIIGESQQIMDVLNKIDVFAPSDLNVLITGETGTGKELVAHEIHNNSPRSSKPFEVLNCAAIPPTLIEDELFGHEKGAYTDATRRRLGKMERADGGTLFLDEIGDMAPELQAKFLRAIQEKEFERVGGERPIKVDVRFVAATNHDLQEAMQSGAFREDLFYRLRGMEIALPPLRDRKADIPLLVKDLLHYPDEDRQDIQITDEATEFLVNYHWPGNIRELQQCIRSTIVLANSDTIRPEHLPPEVKIGESPEVTQEGILIKPGTTIKEAEEALIRETLKVAGSKKKAAEMLRISIRTLYNKLREYGIQG